MQPHDLAQVGPTLCVLGAALAALVADWFLPRRAGAWPAGILGLLGLAGAGTLILLRWREAATPGTLSGSGLGAFGRGVDPAAAGTEAVYLLHLDRFAVYAQGILIAAAIGSLLLGLAHAERRPALRRMEHPVILLVATGAMMLATMAKDLVFLFLCVETFSIGLYVLAGFRRDDRAGQEAALKYFVLGAFAAGFLLYGAALVYAATGSTQYDLIRHALEARGKEAIPPLAAVGLALLLVGLAFKVALAPFHQWTPDVYEGAPLSVTAFMATATKAAAFAALCRLLWTAFPTLEAVWTPVLSGLAVVTLVLGNLVALVQADLKRMLAYSAVAQSGYLLIALLAGGSAGRGALLFYLAAYSWMTLGAFAALEALGSRSDDPNRDATRLEDLRGLAGRSPALAWTLGLFLVALTGLPPTAGFLGKWYIFDASLGAGQVGLAVALIAGSVLSAFAYLRPVVLMTLGPADDAAAVAEPGSPVAVVLAVCALLVAGVLFLGGGLAAASRAASLHGAPALASRPSTAPGAIFMASPPELDARMAAKAAKAAAGTPEGSPPAAGGIADAASATPTP